ncbi:MAG: hypothetical protein RL118_844 [Actinomycetota bacterium]|jgi:iron uptake system component EfeO
MNHRLFKAASVLAILTLTAATLTACSSATSQTRILQVTQAADACTFGATSIEAGLIKFSVTNESENTNEFYLLAADKTTVLGEIESVAAATTRTMLKTLEAGEYFGRCKTSAGKTIAYVPFTVSGDLAAELAETPAERKVSDAYAAWVTQQAQDLLDGTRAFAAAVKAGNVALAKSLYDKTRWHWEAIEPVAESFGDLDPILDAREGDLEPGTPWTGWHALEKQLWITGLQADATTLADGLVANTAELVERIPTVRFNVLDMANGSKALLDEVATGKITGEEERYSRTDLVDFAANIHGARKIVTLVSPLFTNQDDKTYLGDLLARFDELEAALFMHSADASADKSKYVAFVSYDELTADQISDLAFLVEGVSEPIALLATKISSQS